MKSWDLRNPQQGAPGEYECVPWSLQPCGEVSTYTAPQLCPELSGKPDCALCTALCCSSLRQDKEAWIKVKYVEKKFLKKLPNGEALAENERKPRRWCVKKCQRHNSATKAPTARRKYRHEAGNASPAMLSSGGNFPAPDRAVLAWPPLRRCGHSCHNTWPCISGLCSLLGV